jgi:hypothetical protein
MKTPIEIISTRNQENTFFNHFSRSENKRILFSAPFGQGKTTFLNLFFLTQKNKYNCFNLFPTIYSIASNKDILEYMKHDILFQLLSKDLEFDSLDVSNLDILPSFLKNNFIDVILPFLNCIPHIGGNISKVADSLIKLSEKFKTEKDEHTIDDKAKALEFLESFYNKEGSIYDDNFITQLIRQLLQQLKTTEKKENVLIIDDLDRIDPDHLFRILNVFAVHFEDNNENSIDNKFAFDKIILVCDYQNIKDLFTHRYGSNASFSGYLGKFFSSSIYHFDNIEENEKLILSMDNKYSQLRGPLLLGLFRTQNLSLREAIKYSLNDNMESKLRELQRTHNNIIAFCLAPLKFICSQFDSYEFEQRVIFCKNKINIISINNFDNYDYQRFVTNYLFPCFFIPHKKTNIEINKRTFRLSFIQDDTQASNISISKIELLNKADNTFSESEYKFSKMDFYEIIRLIIVKYREVLDK